MVRHTNIRPTFSIITPSLNQGRFLEDCIASVRLQNWNNVEHIIVDGGSTDQTLEILERNKSHFNKIIVEKDEGAADAINKGISFASGDIVAWLNVDDFYVDGAFEAVADAWKKNKSASFWFGNGLRVNENGHELSVFSSFPITFNYNALVEGLDYILQPSTFINPKTFIVAGKLDLKLRWAFDWDLWIRLAQLAPPVAIDRLLSASREWGGTLTSSGKLTRADELRRVAERHTGRLTHGALRYWLDSLRNEIGTAPGVFSTAIVQAVGNLEAVTAQEMSTRLSVDGEGMPRFGQSIGDTSLRIAVDCFPLIPGVSGGIVPWIEGVLRAYVRAYPEDDLTLFFRGERPPLDLKNKLVKYVRLSEDLKSFYEELTKVCKDTGVQSIMRTYPQEAGPEFPLSRQLFVIPDAQHEYFPEFFSREIFRARRRAFDLALSSAGAIATLTAHSQETLRSNPWAGKGEIFLMPAALPEELKVTPAIEDLPAEAKAFSQYFYMPANLWPHKNHQRLFAAFREALPLLPPNTGLILSGNKEGLSERLAGYESLPIRHLGYLPHGQVAALLKWSTAMVYFSLFEGFGIPLLEAFSHGTPVLCANTSSLPEVGGDAILSCDPTDVTAMAALMVQVSQSPGLRETLSSRALLRLSEFNWEIPAANLHAALDAISEPDFHLKGEDPLVSIVMPTRNHGEFIRESIDSVLQQNYPKIELIVQDGLSTDETTRILDSYGDRIRWFSEPDTGQTNAINRGFGRSHGRILGYLNSDDKLLPGAIAEVVRVFSEHPDYDLIYGDADYIDKSGSVIGRYNTAEFSMERAMADNCICQPAAFWRKRISDRIGPFNEDLQTAMDYEYWLRAANADGKIQYIQTKLAQSRLHADAKTLKMRRKIYEEVFNICLTQGGYVSFSYIQGLWAYRFHESWWGGSLVRRVFPRLYSLPALVHFTIQTSRADGGRAGRHALLRTLFRSLESRFPLLGRLARSTWRRSAVVRRMFG